MTTPRRRTRSPLAPLLLGLALAASGCASGARALEREQELRRARAHLDLGLDHLLNDRPALALRELLSAQGLDPRNPRIHYGLAQAYLRQLRRADAEAHLREALALQPGFHDARLMLSALYIELARYPEALAEAQVLIDDPTYPAPWRAHANRGWVHYKLGDLAQARRELELALEYNDRFWTATLNLGILAGQEGRRLEAIEHFRRTLELDPGASGAAEANYRLAETYISLGQRERAMSHLRAAVAQTPDGPWGRKSEEYLKLLQ
jgi:Tfp pilus assembly protein PilF